MVDTNLIKEVKRARALLDELKLQRKVAENMLGECNGDLVLYTKTLADTEKARVIVQNVANSIQKDLEFRITNIVTMALAAVFPDPYEFKAEFVTRRNQTEVDFSFIKDGNECDPMESSGGGPIDIASIALRMAIWSIKKTRAIQILDEPTRNVSRDYQENASTMLKELSDKLGIQMIIVSHIPEMISAADQVVHVEQKGGIANVRVIN